MPVNHNGAFGASRPGERPPECVSGHCGVDIGNVWGEPIHAAHDGVVEWVDRGPNEDRGGIFVKIAHRNGTLFSWYFHLAAVPRRMQRGAKIAAGDVIGLLGDTGVKQSGPHLHFSLSVKTSKTTERYIDPEPLIALWPLWVLDAEGSGRPSSAIEPGVPVRRSPHRAKPAEATPVVEPPAQPPAEPTETLPSP
jgi:murein DD-endopeptidase MepM/ murein hydrolase activator NlpD